MQSIRETFKLLTPVLVCGLLVCISPAYVNASTSSESVSSDSSSSDSSSTGETSSASDTPSSDSSSTGETSSASGTSSSVEPEPTSACGNGKIEGDEECDDGNTDDGDGCSSNCQKEGWCGDEAINDWPFEDCDPPGQRVNPNTGLLDTCSPNCRWMREVTACGNGVIDSDEEHKEECDFGILEGVTGYYKFCTVNCKKCYDLDLAPEGSARCGDGIVDFICGEECEPVIHRKFCLSDCKFYNSELFTTRHGLEDQFNSVPPRVVSTGQDPGGAERKHPPSAFLDARDPVVAADSQLPGNRVLVTVSKKNVTPPATNCCLGGIPAAPTPTPDPSASTTSNSSSSDSSSLESNSSDSWWTTSAGGGSS